jgi:hypothetical protein
MKAIVFVFLIFRKHAAPELLPASYQTPLPLWTWFIENPRGF